MYSCCCWIWCIGSVYHNIVSTCFLAPCCRLILHFKALYRQNDRLCCIHWSQNTVILFPIIQCKEMPQNIKVSIHNSVTVRCFYAEPWNKKHLSSISLQPRTMKLIFSPTEHTRGSPGFNQMLNYRHQPGVVCFQGCTYIHTYTPAYEWHGGVLLHCTVHGEPFTLTFSSISWLS